MTSTRREFLIESVVGLGAICAGVSPPKTTIHPPKFDHPTYLYPCVTADVPNKNGRIYPRAVLEKAVADFKNGGDMYGQMGMHNGGVVVYLADVSHLVKNLELRDNFQEQSGTQLVAEIRVLCTPQGKVLQKMLDDNLVEFRTAGIGPMVRCNEDGNLVIGSDFKLVSVNAIQAGTGA